MTQSTAEQQLVILRRDELSDAANQTRNARRIDGVSKANTPVKSLWFGKVFTGPGEVSDPHHHGNAETGGYVFKGNAFIRFGERYEQIVYLEEGDFLYVAPGVPHIEGNLSHTEELIWMTTRNPDNVVINLTDQDIADIEVAYID